MISIFEDCSGLSSLNLSNTNVSDMSFLFYVCKKLTSLDLSNFFTSKVKNMRSMFND